MIFIVLVVLRSQRGDRYINLPGPPIFFLFDFFFFGSILRQGIQTFFFFLTAPPAAGIPTYISPPPKKTKIWAFFHFVWGKENFKLYWIFFLFFMILFSVCKRFRAKKKSFGVLNNFSFLCFFFTADQTRLY